MKKTKRNKSSETKINTLDTTKETIETSLPEANSGETEKKFEYTQGAKIQGNIFYIIYIFIINFFKILNLGWNTFGEEQTLNLIKEEVMKKIKTIDAREEDLKKREAILRQGQEKLSIDQQKLAQDQQKLTESQSAVATKEQNINKTIEEKFQKEIQTRSAEFNKEIEKNVQSTRLQLDSLKRECSRKEGERDKLVQEIAALNENIDRLSDEKNKVIDRTARLREGETALALHSLPAISSMLKESHELAKTAIASNQVVATTALNVSLQVNQNTRSEISQFASRLSYVENQPRTIEYNTYETHNHDSRSYHYDDHRSFTNTYEDHRSLTITDSHNRQIDGSQRHLIQDSLNSSNRSSRKVSVRNRLTDNSEENFFNNSLNSSSSSSSNSTTNTTTRFKLENPDPPYDESNPVLAFTYVD